MGAVHRLSARDLDVQTEWALAIALQSMSVSALNGLSVWRTQSIIDHLRAAAASSSISMDLRLTCDKLFDVWRTIDLL
jgi:hypothetical protein